MSKNKKLSLTNIEVKSFLTRVDGVDRVVKGGKPVTIGAFVTDCCPPNTIGAFVTDCCPPPTIGAFVTDCC